MQAGKRSGPVQVMGSGKKTGLGRVWWSGVDAGMGIPGRTNILTTAGTHYGLHILSNTPLYNFRAFPFILKKAWGGVFTLVFP